jgi:hypothetical protein
MPINDARLGGRIALVVPSAMDASQKMLYGSILKESIPWAESCGFVGALPDGRVSGPFNLALQSPEIGAA